MIAWVIRWLGCLLFVCWSVLIYVRTLAPDSLTMAGTVADCSETDERAQWKKWTQKKKSRKIICLEHHKINDEIINMKTDKRQYDFEH